MSFCQFRSSCKRRSLVRRDDRRIPKFNDSDGEQSGCHDVSMDDSLDRSEPSDFLEIDLPTPSPLHTPRFSRRINKTSSMSPIPFNLTDSYTEDEEERVPSMPCSPCTVYPPNRRLRALRLFDTPHTPKSIVEKYNRRKLRERRPKRTVKEADKPQANVNPFDVLILQNSVGSKRTRSVMERSLLDDLTEESSDDLIDLDDDIPSSKKLALREINTSRYNEEFHEVCKLGDGEYGSVYKCVHRLDGCTYAIKKSKMPVAGSVYERNAMNEVYAHSVLGKHQHVVRYYSAWAENDHMYIQNEYCNGGSLQDVIEDHKNTGRQFSEDELKQILYQVTQGLKYIHSLNLVHLDIKPGNIFLHRNPKILASPESGLDSCEEDEEEPEQPIMYKIGDLGHVTSVVSPVTEEGDCRYLPKEILNDDFDHLPKADIFSLGMTIFVAGSDTVLPKNGEDWHRIRDGHLPDLPQCSAEFNCLLKQMIHPDPLKRPSTQQLSQDALLCPVFRKTRQQLRKELNEEKFKNQILSEKLIQATQFLTQFTPVSSVPTTSAILSGKSTSRSSRLVGSKMKRSLSLTAF